MTRVGLVLVAHSAKLVEGIAELAAQMAPDVVFAQAGGRADGGIGTDYDSVVAAAQRADRGGGVVLLYDLGSAQMTAELAAESLANPDSVVVVDAPIVEGAIAAAVAAQGEADRAMVAEAGASAREDLLAERAGETGEAGGPEHSVELVLRNDVGLHARPAALLARSITDVDALVRVDVGDQTADAESVLGLMALGARKGDRIEVRARGSQADLALDRIRDLVDRNFAE